MRCFSLDRRRLGTKRRLWFYGQYLFGVSGFCRNEPCLTNPFIPEIIEWNLILETFAPNIFPWTGLFYNLSWSNWYILKRSICMGGHLASNRVKLQLVHRVPSPTQAYISSLAGTHEFRAQKRWAVKMSANVLISSHYITCRLCFHWEIKDSFSVSPNFNPWSAM